MTATIYNNTSVQLATFIYDGLQPTDPCTQWYGTYENGITGGILTVSSSKSPSLGIPYISTSVVDCALPNSNSGSLTATFFPNNYTGTVEFTNTVSDALGRSEISNSLTYICVEPGGLVVDAGPDASSLLASYDFVGATHSGGVGPYTYAWSVSSAPIGTNVLFDGGGTILNDTAIGLTVNGDYEFELSVEPAVGSPVTDIVTITRTGAPTAPPISWQFFLTAGAGSLQIKINSVTVVNAQSGSSGTITSGIGVGDTVEILVRKNKDLLTPPSGYEYQNTATLNIDENGSSIFSDIESAMDALASISTTFTFTAGSTYEIFAGAERTLIEL